MLKINTATYATSATLAVGANPRHVSVAADGSTAYVSRFITPPLAGEGTTAVNTTAGGGEVVVVNSGTMAVQRTIVLAHSNLPDAENQGRGIPNYLGAAALSPDGSQAFVPGKQDKIARGTQRDGLALNFQNTVRAISSRFNLATQAEDPAARIDHDRRPRLGLARPGRRPAQHDQPARPRRRPRPAAWPSRWSTTKRAAAP